MIQQITRLVLTGLVGLIPEVLRTMRSTRQTDRPLNLDGITPVLNGGCSDTDSIQEQLGRCRHCGKVLIKVQDLWLEFPYQWETLPRLDVYFPGSRGEWMRKHITHPTGKGAGQ